MARGDHIKVKRMGGVYTHHGIDMGDGTVVHFSGEPLRQRRAEVRRDDMDTFLEGGKLKRVKHGDAAQEVDAIIEAAEAALGQKGYNLVFGNCEHFACHCATGKWRSAQAYKVVAGMTVALVGTVALGTGMYVVKRLAQRAGGRIS